MAAMMADPLSFQPWARKTVHEGSLKDVLARVAFERGHFRDITEASLQEEIATEGALELSESEEEEEDGEEGEDAQKGPGKPSTREELYKAKYEMLAHVRAAEQEVLMSLDFVSLLLSKDAPKVAQTSISPVLKEAVPLGSLGTDLWHRMPVDHARQIQDDSLATNVRMEGLQQSADNLLAAANRLQDNVRKETEYWNQVLSISDKGWHVSRVPGQQNRLGVRFGFGESSPEFSRKGIAALNTGSDGTIMLDRGIGSKPNALLVVLRQKGQIVGRSKLPNVRDADETTLEARIRYARDSLYDEELYHEMIRESRTVASLGVVMKGSAIVFDSQSKTTSDIQVSFELVSLDDGLNFSSDSSTEKDALAQAIVLATRLLLGQAHRERLKKRSEIRAPLSEKQKDERPILPILRPVMAFVMHRTAINRLNSYLKRVLDMLEVAKIQSSCDPPRLDLPAKDDKITTEALISTFTQSWLCLASIKLTGSDTENVKLSFIVETTLSHNFCSVFSLNTPSQKETYHFDNFEEVVTATDAKLASGLAKAMEGWLGTDWSCNENEALLIKDTGPFEKSQNLWVNFDTTAGTLSVNSLTKNISWSLDGEQSKSGFWDVAGELMELQK